MSENEHESWDEYRRQILGTLDQFKDRFDRMEGKIDALNDKHSAIKELIVALQTKAALMGTLGGFVISAIISLFFKSFGLK